MTTTIACGGCAAQVPDVDGPTHRYIGAAPGCWAVYGEVLALDYGELGMPAEHRLVVDAYAAQHPGHESLQTIRSVAVHLIALHLVLERAMSPLEVTKALRYHAKRPEYHWLEPPDCRGSVTVLDLRGALGAEAYAQACWRWARSVWLAWEPHHQQVRAWASP